MSVNSFILTFCAGWSEYNIDSVVEQEVRELADTLFAITSGIYPIDATTKYIRDSDVLKDILI